ncbi:DUF6119 family protein [Streptomyces sp. SCSIO 30461]|uniref:DUF6119 family protein n=1 Tax=Streptomyces sp. SCSIO 30461 TaxID=3118085 RepID=UPI0030D02053
MDLPRSPYDVGEFCGVVQQHSGTGCLPVADQRGAGGARGGGGGPGWGVAAAHRVGVERQTALHRGNGVEICDLLSPDNVLVTVKRAQGSDALSHLSARCS